MEKPSRGVESWTKKKKKEEMMVLIKCILWQCCDQHSVVHNNGGGGRWVLRPREVIGEVNKERMKEGRKRGGWVLIKHTCAGRIMINVPLLVCMSDPTKTRG